MSIEVDPYKRSGSDVQEPPFGFKQVFKTLGPGFIIVAGVVGSGELILTTSFGAAVGFTMLWWLLLACWTKSIVHVEMARYAIVSGETFMQAFNRLPGRISVRGKPVSWFLFLFLFLQIPGILRGGGIYGAVGQAAELMLPFGDSLVWTVVFAIGATAIVLLGKYAVIEKLLQILVALFTLITLVCAILLQFTEYAFSWQDIRSGFTFAFPVAGVGIALAVYSATGVNPDEVIKYTYWCVEKGYTRSVGPPDESESWVKRARGWIRVVQIDSGLTLALLTLATVPFYLLGASVLARLGEKPEGLETLNVLSNIYTATLGDWAAWLFSLGAFVVLYSTCVAGLAGGSRIIADLFCIFGFFDKGDFKTRQRYWKGWAIFAPVAYAISYFWAPNPVWLLVVSGIIYAALIPVVTAGTIYLRYKHLDKRVAPSWISDGLLWFSFAFMLAVAGWVVWHQFIA